MLCSKTNFRLVDRGQRMEPLHGAAGFFMGRVLGDFERDRTAGHLHFSLAVQESRLFNKSR